MPFDYDHNLHLLQQNAVGYYLRAEFICKHSRKKERTNEIIEHCIIHYSRENENRMDFE